MAYWLNDDWEGAPFLGEIGMAAWGLYCACGLWVARHLTDGHVPNDLPRRYTRKWREPVQLLVSKGLFNETGTGWFMPHYLDLNPSAEKARHQRKLAAERAARHRRKSCS